MLVFTGSKLTRLVKQQREKISESTYGDTGDKLNWKHLSLWLSLATQPHLRERNWSLQVGVNTEAELWVDSEEGPTRVQLGSTLWGKTGRCLGLTPVETPQEASASWFSPPTPDFGSKIIWFNIPNVIRPKSNREMKFDVSKKKNPIIYSFTAASFNTTSRPGVSLRCSALTGLLSLCESLEYTLNKTNSFL